MIFKILDYTNSTTDLVQLEKVRSVRLDVDFSSRDDRIGNTFLINTFTLTIFGYGEKADLVYQFKVEQYRTSKAQHSMCVGLTSEAIYRSILKQDLSSPFFKSTELCQFASIVRAITFNEFEDGELFEIGV